MKIEYKFNKEELKLICECLDIAKDEIIDKSGDDFYNKVTVIKLRENIVSLINLSQDLNEIE